MKTTTQLAILVLATFNVSAATLYVSLQSTNPVAPYATWVTAATNIQDAVDAARAGDKVLVGDGVYAVGSREVSVLDTNVNPPQLLSIGPSRIVVTNSIKLESVNGPSVTAIVGSTVVATNESGGWVREGGRCVYLGRNAVLSGLTLTNGYTRMVEVGVRSMDGGGVWCESSAVVTNCVIVGNNCWYVGSGGGVIGGTLVSCELVGNSAQFGGGAAGSVLLNCMLRQRETIT